MLLDELDGYFRSVLRIDEAARIDSSLNGLQVGRENQEIGLAAFGVDASMETFRRAAGLGAGLLVVHHGLFWGRDLRVAGHHRARLKFLLDQDLGLYAAHLPLDMHPEIGNNAGMAEALGLVEQCPFGVYKGTAIGVKGRLPGPLTLDEILRLLYGENPHVPGVLPFGKDRIETVGIVSGGGTHEVSQAIEEGLDLYITGDASHTIYHQCLEAGINVLFGGHYATECWGVKLLAEKTARETGLKTVFVDVPTGL